MHDPHPNRIERDLRIRRRCQNCRRHVVRDFDTEQSLRYVRVLPHWCPDAVTGTYLCPVCESEREQNRIEAERRNVEASLPIPLKKAEKLSTKRLLNIYRKYRRRTMSSWDYMDRIGQQVRREVWEAYVAGLKAILDNREHVGG